tara:strand:- start:18 stop:392 length:375 start_codon:yes stop_codon:yes gene_type:complete
MVYTPNDDEDMSSSPSMDTRGSNVPFERDPDWVEAPGSMWTPEMEHTNMPIRDATPAELADTERKRGSSEDETCPIDPLLANLDFTSEYISPRDQELRFKDQLHKYYQHIKPPENLLKDETDVD